MIILNNGFVFYSFAALRKAQMKSLETREEKKNLKVNFVKFLQRKYDLDLTVTLIKRIQNSFFGSSMSNVDIKKSFFIDENRTARNKSKSLNSFDCSKESLTSDFSDFMLTVDVSKTVVSEKNKKKAKL